MKGRKVWKINHYTTNLDIGLEGRDLFLKKTKKKSPRVPFVFFLLYVRCVALRTHWEVRDCVFKNKNKKNTVTFPRYLVNHYIAIPVFILFYLLTHFDHNVSSRAGAVFFFCNFWCYDLPFVPLFYLLFFSTAFSAYTLLKMKSKLRSIFAQKVNVLPL